MHGELSLYSDSSQSFNDVSCIAPGSGEQRQAGHCLFSESAAHTGDRGCLQPPWTLPRVVQQVLRIGRHSPEDRVGSEVHVGRISGPRPRV